LRSQLSNVINRYIHFSQSLCHSHISRVIIIVNHVYSM
jgi:hypothetical protein